MLEAALVATRLVQFACAVVLMGVPLFALYTTPRSAGAAAERGLGRCLALSAAVLAPTAGLAIFVQTAVMAGSFAAACNATAIRAVVIGMPLGWALVGRVALAVVSLAAVLALPPSRGRLWLQAALGAGMVASFAWTGHASADQGWPGAVHLGCDIFHLLAAATWIGALVAFLALLRRAHDGGGEAAALHGALAGFSGVGSAAVGVLLATGLANGWFLVGPDHLAGLFATPYGLVLSAKVGLFAVMLGLAASNRYRLTPRLARALDDAVAPDRALAALRRSLTIETGVAALVLVLVSVLGTLEPLATP